MVKFGDARQCPDILGIGGDCLSDHLHLRVVPVEGLIVVLLTRGHLFLVLGRLFLVLGHLFENTLYAIKPLATVRHFESL
jgi:hypothetical protein